MAGEFTEATWGQVPAMVHLARLGYSYFAKITEDMAGTICDPDTNILLDIFQSQSKKLNPEDVDKIEEILHDIRQKLDNDDLGRSLYMRLCQVSPVRLIDFEHPANKTFHFTAEFMSY